MNPKILELLQDEAINEKVIMYSIYKGQVLVEKLYALEETIRETRHLLICNPRVIFFIRNAKDETIAVVSTKKGITLDLEKI
jgi:hypothetical protein